jgi:oxygen-independent coproporphyrinogen-3 oxidase
VATGQDHQIDLYIEAMSAELASIGEPQKVTTLFLGGGTPTYLDSRRLARLLTVVRHWLPLAEGAEFSIEANPGTLDAEKVNVLAEFGVNRLGLGAQSFRPQTLRVLEREHDPDDVRRAVESIRKEIPRLSMDLIFGAPGQTLADWQADLQQALALEPGHLSTYGLTYEKGTRLWKQRQRGEVIPLDEESELALYTCAIDTLEAAGFEHYEISNFARPGERCRHNQVYWANEAYFGFGMGAARYVLGRRELNTRDLQTYIRRTVAGQSPVFQSEELAPKERARETMAVQLRRREGVNRIAFRDQTGFDLDELAGPALARHGELGLLEDDGQSVSLTRSGKYVADSLIEALL